MYKWNVSGSLGGAVSISGICPMKPNRETWMQASKKIKDLTRIPGVGKSIATDLIHIGIEKVEDLKGKDPYALYELSNRFAGAVQDRCLLYVFKCAVYFAETPAEKQDPEKLKWWNWKDRK
ncbi:MAG TPA: helix-hairpin-helix domain-containing protein [Saprospiraceae bacterium]|nr:helix-hairpin-helix domain-containing protein [Saprospiraceae bacterium]